MAFNPAGVEITSVFPKITLDVEAGEDSGVFQSITLPENTYIYFSAPNYRDGENIYPAYVNYYWKGNTIPENTDHWIADDEALYINYTTVTKDSNGNEIKNVTNKEFSSTTGKQMVIRPNFKLEASTTVANMYGKGGN